MRSRPTENTPPRGIVGKARIRWPSASPRARGAIRPTCTSSGPCASRGVPRRWPNGPTFRHGGSRGPTCTRARSATTTTSALCTRVVLPRAAGAPAHVPEEDRRPDRGHVGRLGEPPPLDSGRLLPGVRRGARAAGHRRAQAARDPAVLLSLGNVLHALERGLRRRPDPVGREAPGLVRRRRRRAENRRSMCWTSPIRRASGNATPTSSASGAAETKAFFLNVIDQAQALGVDALQMDQTTGGAGDACYSTTHGHAPGSGLYQSRAFWDLLDAMRRHGKARSADFVLFHEEPHEQLIPLPGRISHPRVLREALGIAAIPARWGFRCSATSTTNTPSPTAATAPA